MVWTYQPFRAAAGCIDHARPAMPAHVQQRADLPVVIANHENVLSEQLEEWGVDLGLVL